MENNKEAYKGLYAMHKYWGKKPFNEITKFITKYSNKDDVVMDCFCGSGVTLIEALKNGRKAIGVDINPLAIKLTKASISYVDIGKLKETFKIIESKVKSSIDSLYEIQRENGIEKVTHIVWKNEEPIEVWYEGEKRKKEVRPGEQIDLEMSNNPKIKPKWYPTTKLFENSRINVHKDERVCDLFTPRALVGLSLIADEISKIEDENIRDAMELTLTGTLSQASKLVFVIRRRGNGANEGKAEVGSWVVGYWVPEEHFEIHVWKCFENRFKRIIKGKEDVNSFFESTTYYDNMDKELYNERTQLVFGSATEIPIDDDSVDYVFIDPPHANRILYMEMSLMWNAWLKLDDKIEWDKEIIVSESKERNKTSSSYNELLNEAFKEIARTLKKGKYFSMAFNCMDDNTWLDTLNLFIKNGFVYEEIYPLEYSATSVVQANRENALKTDFVLTWKNSQDNNQNEIVFNNDMDLLKEYIEEYKLQFPNAQPYQVINYLFMKTLKDGFIFKITKIISNL